MTSRLIPIASLRQLATAASDGRRLAATPALVDELEGLARDEHILAPADLAAFVGGRIHRVTIAHVAAELLAHLRAGQPSRQKCEPRNHSAFRGLAA